MLPNKYVVVFNDEAKNFFIEEDSLLRAFEKAFERVVRMGWFPTDKSLVLQLYDGAGFICATDDMPGDAMSPEVICEVKLAETNEAA